MDSGATLPLFERRTAAEWALLQALAERNPGRLRDLRREESTFHLRLLGTQGVLLDGSACEEHNLRIDFPVHYPAMPMTLHLQRPVLHPNVHPGNGFVCLWNRHGTSNTVEHALHKTVAILSGQLFNTDPQHVLQPAALDGFVARQSPCGTQLLLGVEAEPLEIVADKVRRRRLS